jgi:hypothetical protein
MIRFTSFPLTEPPPVFIAEVVSAFRAAEAHISTHVLDKGLTSNEVLGLLRPSLSAAGFQIEAGKRKGDKIERPVFYGENGEPTLNYHVDAYQPEWRCGLEIEAGRAWMGNAVYRDLIQALVMVQVEHLIIAVPNAYKYASKATGKSVISADYSNAKRLAEALYGHTRMRLPYGLTVIGY